MNLIFVFLVSSYVYSINCNSIFPLQRSRQRFYILTFPRVSKVNKTAIVEMLCYEFYSRDTSSNNVQKRVACLLCNSRIFERASKGCIVYIVKSKQGRNDLLC